MVDPGKEAWNTERDWQLSQVRVSFDAQAKFTFFMLGLTFAILGLSVQVTEPPISIYSKIAWGTLLLSQ